MDGCVQITGTVKNEGTGNQHKNQFAVLQPVHAWMRPQFGCMHIFHMERKAKPWRGIVLMVEAGCTFRAHDFVKLALERFALLAFPFPFVGLAFGSLALPLLCAAHTGVS